MANQSISQLTSATTPLNGSVQLPIVQNSQTKKATAQDISATAGSPIFQPDIISYGGTTMGGIAISMTDYAPIVFWSRQIVAPNLTTIYGTIHINGNGSYGDPILETISMPLLQSVGSLVANGDTNVSPIYIDSFNYLETIDFSSLTTIHFNNGSAVRDYLEIQNNPMLTTLNISSLTTLTAGDISIAYNSSLTNVSIGSLTTFNGDFSAYACALNQATIDAILYQLAAVVFLSNKIVDLAGGTNAAPSVTGQSYVTLLTGAGCTVYTN